MTDLDDLLDTQAGAPPESVGDLTITKALITSLGGGPMPDFAALTPERRADLVHELEQVRAIIRAAMDRKGAIEQAIRRAGVELSALELRMEGGTVRLKMPSDGYVTKDATLRDELLTLVAEGDLDRTEVDAAIPEVIGYKPDHRKLNALLKRGERVRTVIESNRTKKLADPLAAKVEIHHKGGLK